MKKFLALFCFFAATSAFAQTPTATATDTPTPTPTATASATATATGTPVPTPTPLSALYRQDTEGAKKALELKPSVNKQVIYDNSGNVVKTTAGPNFAYIFLGNPDDVDTLSDISWHPSYGSMSIGNNPASFHGSALGGAIFMQDAEWPVIQNRDDEANAGGGVVLDTSLIATPYRRQKFQDKDGTFAYLSDIPSPTPYPTPTPDVSDTAYNASSWDGVTTIAPSKNAVRDKIELVIASITAVPTPTPYPTPTPSTVGAKSILSVVGDGLALSTLTGTIYTCPSDPGLGLGSFIADEQEVSFVAPFACTLKNLNVRTDTDNAAVGTPTTVIVVRKTQVDTALTVTMNQSNATTTTDSTHSVSFSAGDKLTISITTTGLAATSAGIASITMECDQS